MKVEHKGGGYDAIDHLPKLLSSPGELVPAVKKQRGPLVSFVYIILSTWKLATGGFGTVISSAAVPCLMQQKPCSALPFTC